VKRRQTALAMLAAAGRDGVDFFRDAVRSLAAGLGYRWAGIAISSTTARASSPSPSATAGRSRRRPRRDRGTPCQDILERGGFLAVERDAAASIPAAACAMCGAVSYVGDLVFDVAGRPIPSSTGSTTSPIRCARAVRNHRSGRRISCERSARGLERGAAVWPIAAARSVAGQYSSH